MNPTCKVFFIAFAIVVLTTFAFAQGAATGDLHVTVRDQKGGAVTNATVTAREQAKGFERSTKENVDGEYPLLALPPGKYTVSVSAPGFADVDAKNQDVTVGQMQDLAAPFGGDLSTSEVLAVQRMKTGGYSFELPLRLGGLLAGASEALLDALERFARPLGLAFQIADDLLGTFGSPEVTGKPNASDLREGKRTLLVARALEAADPRDAALLRAGLGKPDLGEAEAAALREALVRSGADSFWVRGSVT